MHPGSGRLRRRALLAVPLLLPGLAARAQPEGEYPNRPVRFIVPYPPGQATDTHARLVAEALNARWPHRVVVENRAGGAGAIGMEAGARAVPDGYTLTYTAIGTANVLPVMVPTVPYDTNRDFMGVMIASVSAVMWVVHPSLPVRTIQDFVAYARENQVDYASAGPGTVQHMAAELFRARLGLKLHHVAYRGSGQAVTDTVAGVVVAMMDSLTSALPHVRAGRLRALAVTSPHRQPALPDVPSIGESVIPGYDIMGWTGLLAPMGVPEPILRKLNADAVAGMHEPEMRARFENTGSQLAPPWNLAESTAFVRERVHFWRGVVQEAGLRIDG